MTFTLTANFDDLDGGADTETTEVTIDSNVQVISSGGAIFSRLTATVTNGILSVTLPDNTATPNTFGFVVRRAYGYTKKWQVPVQAPGATVDLSQFTGTTPLPIPSSLESRVEALEAGGGGGGATDLDDLTDVVITAPAAGEVLRHNGTNWVDAALVKGDVGLGNVDNTADTAKPVSTAQAAADTAVGAAAATDATTKANAAQAAAISAAATDATTKANAAQAAAIAASQPVDSDLTAIAALTTTAYGRAFLALANQAALLGLLPAASETVASIIEIATQAETNTGTDDARAVTPLKLQTRLAAYAQPLDSDLTSIAALSTTAFGRTFLDLADAAAARTKLALGTAATVNTGTSSGDVPLLSTGGVLPIARLATGTPDGTKFVRDDGTLVTPSGGGGGSTVFGDGSDGAVVISSNTSLSRDMFYSTLTVNAGVALDTNGYRIYAKTSITNNGTIRANGGNAAGSGSGGGGATGSVGSGKSGGNGSTTNGAAGASSSGDSFGGNGGAGAAGSSGAGGAAGTTSAPSPSSGSLRATGVGVALGSTSGRGGVVWFNSGAGGGGGGGNSTQNGGGGGAGGGVVAIGAAAVTNNGTISANGGNGASGDNTNCSGGGGGGGGVVIVLANTYTGTTPIANGGSGGVGPLNNGTAGAAGTVLVLTP